MLKLPVNAKDIYPVVLAFAWTWLYLFLEWLFFATKPSFLSPLNAPSKVLLLITSATLVALVFAAISAILLTVSKAPRLPKKLKALLNTISYLPAAFVVASLALILVDNFSYVAMGFSIFMSQGWLTVPYVLFFFFMTYVFLRKTTLNRNPEQPVFGQKLGVPLMIAVTFLFVIIGGIKLLGQTKRPQTESKALLKKPNILIFSSDGVNANHMGIYGYERQTTPFLMDYIKDSLFFEKHLSNSGKTTGAIASLLTGKHPTTTRVIFPPDILKGRDCYEHLPGLLKRQGYYNIDIGERHYADARDFNLRQGFDWGNSRRITELFNLPGLEYEAYFIEKILSRIQSRLFHIFHIEMTVNPFEIVSKIEWGSKDPNRIRELFTTIESTGTWQDETFHQRQPFFAHLHLLGTHGPIFTPKNRRFSNNQPQSDVWLDDFYDDSILDFDMFFKQTVARLKKMGIYDNTLIIFNSDHGQKWSAEYYLPLFVRFPNDEFAGRNDSLTQRIDIAPTILDYLGHPIPDWMEGISLLGAIKDRPIYMVKAGKTQPFGNLTFTEDYSPPFYSLGEISKAADDQCYSLNVKDGTLYRTILDDQESPQPLTPDEVYKDLRDYLTSKDYPTEELPALVL